jgi:Domain of Unknown Function with PDB structure (DUF3858)/Transglutaminase-like superfamily
MRTSKTVLVLIIVTLSAINLRAQDFSGYKFGRINPADFNLTADKFDSNANVLIIADVGRTGFEGNDKGFFSMVFTRFMRVKIMNKNGFNIGNQEIQLYHSDEGDYEKLITLKASTFNLENGVIKETKLDDKSVFTEKFNDHIDLKKFSLPALKEGSIFDLVYTTKSPYSAMLQPWSFQGENPQLLSDYEVIIPPSFHYVMKLQGDQNFEVNTTKFVPMTYSIRESKTDGYTNAGVESNLYSMNANSLDKHWVKKNVPALHEEPYTTTLKNYYSRVSFQLNFFQWTASSEKEDYMPDWKTTSRHLLEKENFGMALTHENNWMSDELKGVIEGAQSDHEKTYRIFNYVRDNFNTVGKKGYNKNSMYTENTLKEVFKSKEGNVAEINLLLVAMLRKAGIGADPLILSTRDFGIANVGYPLIQEYDYVICVYKEASTTFVLDASQPFIGFGQLSPACYNGWGHVINENDPMAIQFTADSLLENSMTNVIIFNDDKGKTTGTCTSILGKVESYNTRREINTSLNDYTKKIRTASSSDITIDNVGFDSLKKYDFPLTMHYDFELKNLSSSDFIYFQPMMEMGYKKNPFESADRHYPVEIPYQLDDMYTLTMDIPAGYKVDELPKSARVAYNDKEGMFEYLIQAGAENIQMRVHLKLNKAFFPADEYNTLRDFFAYVVKKENEQIVFKKIK